jgi:hypothetical protein
MSFIEEIYFDIPNGARRLPRRTSAIQKTAKCDNRMLSNPAFYEKHKQVNRLSE